MTVFSPYIKGPSNSTCLSSLFETRWRCTICNFLAVDALKLLALQCSLSTWSLLSLVHHCLLRNFQRLQTVQLGFFFALKHQELDHATPLVYYLFITEYNTWSLLFVMLHSLASTLNTHARSSHSSWEICISNILKAKYKLYDLCLFAYQNCSLGMCLLVIHREIIYIFKG